MNRGDRRESILTDEPLEAYFWSSYPAYLREAANRMGTSSHVACLLYREKKDASNGNSENTLF